MMRLTFPLQCAAVFLLFGCPSEDDPMVDSDDSGDTEADTEGDTNASATGPVDQEHDCASYEPSVVSDQVTGMFPDGEVIVQSITAPSEIGGGYLTVRLEVDRGRASFTAAHSGGGGIGAPTATNPPEDGFHEIAFEVYDGETYDINMSVSQVLTENFPVQYTLSWTFTGVEDCYEHNDVLEFVDGAPQGDSSSIPTGQIIEAYALPGYLSDGAFQWKDDWYDFTLTEPGEVTIELLQSPSDIRSRFGLSSADGVGIETSSSQTNLGGLHTLGPVQLEAGTYYLRWTTQENGSWFTHTGRGDPLPDHWVTPYQFTVEVN